VNRKRSTPEDKCKKCNAPITWAWVDSASNLFDEGSWVPVDVGTDAKHKCRRSFVPRIK
jgi:hypothetical protein